MSEMEIFQHLVRPWAAKRTPKIAQIALLVVKVYKPPLCSIESQFRCDFRKLSENQKRASSVEVNRKQVQPVSLHTR